MLLSSIGCTPSANRHFLATAIDVVPSPECETNRQCASLDRLHVDSTWRSVQLRSACQKSKARCSLGCTPNRLDLTPESSLMQNSLSVHSWHIRATLLCIICRTVLLLFGSFACACALICDHRMFFMLAEVGVLDVDNFLCTVYPGLFI